MIRINYEFLRGKIRVLSTSLQNIKDISHKNCSSLGGFKTTYKNAILVSKENSLNSVYMYAPYGLYLSP